MSLNDSLDQVERAKLAVWDYPVSDKFTNMWVSMEESGFPATFKDATSRIKQENGEKDEFAFIGQWHGKTILGCSPTLFVNSYAVTIILTCNVN